MRKVMNLNLPFAQYHFAEAKGTQKRRFSAYDNPGEDFRLIGLADGSEHEVTTISRGQPQLIRTL